MKPRVVTAVVCDDIRREDNGKEILIGVYTTDLRLQGYPAQIPVSVWILLEGTLAKEHKFTVQIAVPGNPNAVFGQGTLESPGHVNGRSSIAIRGALLTIVGPGELTVKVALGNDKPKVVATLPILLGPPTRPEAPLIPSENAS